MKSLRVFLCDDHDCVQPTGVASVIVARDEDEARRLLDAQLATHGLKPFALEPYTLKPLSLTEPCAVVIQNGDY